MLFHYTIAIQNFTGQTPLDGLLRGGHSGVEYFFVLSGFIILYAHRGDLGRPGEVGGFFAKRAIRILPMLWTMLIIWGLARTAMAGQTTRGATGIGTMLMDMLLLPHDPPYVLGVTWTLTRELVFYTLFALVIVNRRIGWSAIVLWQLGVVIYALRGVQMSPWPEALFETHNLGFGLGLLIGLAILRPPPGRALGYALAIAGAAAFTALLLCEWQFGRGMKLDAMPLGDFRSPVLYLLAATVLVFGLVSIDRARAAAKSPLLAYAGGCSYVLYLIHIPLGSVSVRLFKHAGAGLPPVAKLIVMAVIAVAGALIVHVAVEKPLVKLLRARLMRRKPAGDAVLPEPMRGERV
jgi:exopolysaccharide production protein ExoZ